MSTRSIFGLVVWSVLFLGGTGVSGQSTLRDAVTAQIDVQIEIIGSSLSVVAEKGLEFGNVRAGDGRVFVPKDNDRAGVFVVEGGRGMPVTIEFRGPQGGRLERYDGDGWMQVATELYGSHEHDAGVADPLQLGETVTLGDDGRYYCFLQAALDVLEETQNPPGEYTGTFTLEVAYQ